MMEEIMKEIKDGCRLYVMKDNEAAINLYKKFGFKIIGMTDTETGPAHVMEWRS